MTRTPDPAFDAYVADLNARGLATTARLAREAADKRMNDLAELMDSLEHRSDIASFNDLMSRGLSSRYQRFLRAKALRTARKFQLFGSQPDTLRYLSKAAAHRKTEKQRRQIERRSYYSNMILRAAGYAEADA